MNIFLVHACPCRVHDVQSCLTKGGEMLQVGGTAPYAPSRTVVAVIRAKRDNPKMFVFDAEALSGLNVSDSLIPRTLQAVKLLGLITEDGSTTPLFEHLVSDRALLSRRMADLLRDAYAPIFATIDPATASTEELELAFEIFRPAGQRGRMVTFFQAMLRIFHVKFDSSMEPERTDPKETLSRDFVYMEAKSLSSDALQKRGSRSAQNERIVAARSTTSKAVQLSSGGAVTLLLNIDLFTLSKEDRDFVISLVDTIANYESK